ncbi:PaaI family thioesterase [Arcanobacterium buesumense]|uniref:PaaI family thioesterase n=1 Tax=Arcanobacterium buesumense TaxID=2722751 RepID=A0A6H2EKB3_9ACTO|nr:PaaI family thioesterase [Arcanobacterium buesumense]QJC21806.1 PaaI family thioesterase [Arcanobacterium buesumense]
MSTSITDINDGELASRLGAKIEVANMQHVIETIPVAGNTQPFGVLHGGANAFLVEDAASRLAQLHAPEGRFAVGTELNISQLAPNTTELARARATVIRVSHGSCVACVEISDAQGTLTATGRMTCVFIRPPGQ